MLCELHWLECYNIVSVSESCNMNSRQGAPNTSTAQVRNRYKTAELALMGTHFHWEYCNEQDQGNNLSKTVYYNPAWGALTKKYKLAQASTDHVQGADL